MSNYTAKDLDTLRRQAQEIEKVLAAQQASRQQSYAAQQAALATQRENSLRQAYVSRQQALAQLPAQLAQQAAWEDQLAALQAELNALKSKRSSQQPAQGSGWTAAPVQKSAGKGLQHTGLVGHAALVR